MLNCQKCAAPIADQDRFCPTCGAPQAGDATLGADPNQTVPLDPVSPTRTSLPSASEPTKEEGRFIAGAMITDRYRISSMLGRGGMGEVYLAQDIKLGQQVALKFLPPGLEQDPSRLQRFLNEVRTARQVTHPNVCRVYDIDEVDGQHFLSMEYVDGEDMATSLRRFGRLPEERAVEVARQICAGLAAAHDQGILHRDLKPANVMIDGQGRVKLTDFGLAGLAESIDQNDVRAGTPAYMSPEQLAGQEVTVRSDIYSLGIVLYELFTGKPPFQADTVAEYQEMHTATVPSHPSVVLSALDPVVERAIMRCLEKKAVSRPPSALAVAAALPGGDPLQAALAAGETPSPELVAEAGRRDGMSPAKAFLLALFAFAILAGGTNWAGRLTALNYIPLDKRPEVLMDRAQEIVGSMGYGEEVYTDPADRAWGFLHWNDIIREISESDSTQSRWEKLRERPDAMGFWYRQSPQVLQPEPIGGPTLLRGAVTLTNPMAITAGELLVVLDINGRLRRFEVMPKRYSTREPREPDWSQLFALAELDTARFTEARPQYQRFMAPDIRRAWVGTRANQPEVVIRVEAGAFEGRPVLFNVASQASLFSLGKEPTKTPKPLSSWIGYTLQPILILVVVIFAIRRSKRNMESGRSDTLGAARFALIVFVLSVLSKGLASHALFTQNFANEIWPIFAGAVFVSMAAWGLYTAAEPLGRRIWPTMFISSSRLLSREGIQWRDPVVGHSILVGLLVAGIDFALRGPVNWALTAKITGQPHILPWVNLDLLHGQRPVLAMILDQGLMLPYILIHIMALVLIRYLVKNRVVTIVLTLILWTLLTSPGNLTSVFLGLFSSGLFLFVLLRWGVVAMVTGRIALGMAWLARPVDLSSWYSQGSIMVVVALGILALLGAWSAMGNKSSVQVK